MSIERGILLGRDAERLVVEATPQDLVRFDDVLRTLAERGYRIAPSHDGRHWSTDSMYNRRSQIVALLRTRCGCTRDVIVPYPPQPAYRIPLGSTASPLQHGDEFTMNQMTFTMREFRFKGMERDSQHNTTRAVYEELP